jgi:SAM-dependent methyltransferase
MADKNEMPGERPARFRGLARILGRMLLSLTEVRISGCFREEGYSSREDYMINGIVKPRFQSVDLIPEYYDFIALDTHLIKEEFNFVVANGLVGERQSKRFLDVGCGPGNVMLIANSFGFVPFGIEYNPVLVQSAPYRELKQYSPVETEGGIYQQDAFEFLHYGDFDVVYLYCPIAVHNLETNLENLIERQLKKGAIYIANLKQDKSITENPDFEYLGLSNKLPIWRKVR